MAWVYMLRSRSGRHYYGSTVDLSGRLEQHARGHTYTPHRDAPWELVGCVELPTLAEAREAERRLKRWKNPGRALQWFGIPAQG